MEHLEAGSETPHAHDDLAGIRTALARVAMRISGIQVRSKKIFCSLSDRNVTMQNITILPEERFASLFRTPPDARCAVRAFERLFSGCSVVMCCG